ncbi:hypothetical protein [Ekhidna sp.]|uniref:hypothetical protein n=1 Tax=Ekhidna sp. TaxID=2608089 RepID=UPI003296D9FB
MPNSIFILVFVFFGNFNFDTKTSESLDVPSIEFSSSAIGFESGQPVFSRETSIVIDTKDKKNVRVIINEEVDTRISTNTIDLASLVNLSEGTYTILIQGERYEEAFGFTIK